MKENSVRNSPKVYIYLIISTILLLTLTIWALTLGSYHLPIKAIFQILTGTASDSARFIVLDLRLPRILSAIFIGTLLATSGVFFQGVIRNPLASPDIIGINSGASVGAVFWIISGLPQLLVPVAAYLGGFTAAGAVYLLSRKDHISQGRLILVGIGINAIANAVVTYLLLQGNINDVSKAYQWMTGSLYTTDWKDIKFLVISTLILIPVSLVMIRPLKVIKLGDLTAKSVGINLEVTRFSLMAIGCALSATAIAVAGPIGFVALIIPHISAMLTGSVNTLNFILTALLGSLLVLAADVIGQNFLWVNLPVGVIISSLGAPYFLFLMIRHRSNL